MLLCSATHTRSSWAAVTFLPSVWGTTLTGTFGVFVFVAWPVWLMGLLGRGTVWDTPKAPVCLEPVCAGGAFAEPRPLSASVPPHVLFFSAPPAALEPHPLAGRDDVWGATWLGCLFFCPAMADVCVVDLPAGRPAAAAPPPCGFNGAAVDLGPLDGGILDGGRDALLSSGLELHLP